MESQELSKRISIKEMFAGIKPGSRLNKLVSLGLGIILISWLLSQLDIPTAIEILQNIPFFKLVLGFVLYTGSFYLRAVRFKVLLPHNQKKDHLFPIVLVHYTALNIIPARLGELSYMYLLKKINDISAGSSLSSLILARVFDQIAISLLFLFASRFVNLPAQWMRTLKLGIEGFLILIVLILLLILAYKEKFVELLKRFIAKFGWDKHAITQRIMDQIEDIVTAFKEIQAKKKAGEVAGLSLLIWFGIFGVNYVLLRAFDVQLSYVEIVLTSTIIILAGLPLSSLTLLGIREVTWTGIAMTLGVSKNVAIVSAFGTHIVSVLFLFILGTFGLLRLSNIQQKRNPHIAQGE